MLCNFVTGDWTICMQKEKLFETNWFEGISVYTTTTSPWIIYNYAHRLFPMPSIKTITTYYQTKFNCRTVIRIGDRRNSVYAWTLKVWERKGRMGAQKLSSEKAKGGVPHPPFSLMFLGFPYSLFLSNLQSSGINWISLVPYCNGVQRAINTH